MSVFEDLYYKEKENYINTIKELKLEVENLQEKLFEKDMITFSKEHSYSFKEIIKAIKNGDDLKNASYYIADAFDLIDKYGLRKFIDYFRRVELENE